MKINGSLAFDASSASEIQNLRVEKVSSDPTAIATDVGRFIYNTTSKQVKVGYDTGAGYAWQSVATGGSAFSQAEGDAIEASLGAGINTDGTFHAAGFPAQDGLVSPTSFTDAINQLAAYASGNNELRELDDVTLTSPAAGQFLEYDGTKWVNHTIVLTDVSDVTSTAAEVNELHSAGAVNADFVKLHAVTAAAADLNLLTGAAAGTGAFAGAAISSTEISYLDGATSNIQTQLNNKQPLDADLTSVAALATTGIVVRSAANTFVTRTLVAPAAGVTISDPAGIAGNPTFALANDLAALEGLTTTGYIVRTGDGTATTRAIAGTVGNIVVTNGDGVASDTSIDLGTVSQAATGNFVKVTLDAYGRVVGNTPVLTADITALVDATYVNTSGDTMTGSLVMSSGTHVTLPDSPVNGTDAANKAYVDALQNGLSWKQAVRAATTANITLSAPQTVDGIALIAGDRVLVKDQSTTSQNGIYLVAAGAWTRVADMDQAAEFDGSATFVQEGTVNEGTGWTETLTVATVGTSPVSFSQFSGGVAYIWGTGLSNVGNIINVNLGAGIAQLPSDEVGIDLYDEPNGALILTTDGSTHVTTTGAQLYLRLDAAGALAQTSSGLKINAASVTNAMLVNPAITFNTDANSPDDVNLGETVQIIGTSTQGISTNGPSNNVIQITASNASSSQKGVATFNTADFAVTAGDVTIKAAGVDNAQLAFSTINFVGSDASSDTVALGESATFADVTGGHAGGALLQSSVAANTITLSARQATVSAVGVASFPAVQFSVTGGAVTIATTIGQGALTNVNVSVDTASDKDLFQYDVGTSKWKNVAPSVVAANIALGDLSDVGSASPTDNGVLVGNGTSWNTQQIYFLHTQGSASTSWTVSHGLGQKYCVVTVVDSTDEVVIPQSITFDSTTQLTVTFNTAITGKVVVMGIA